MPVSFCPFLTRNFQLQSNFPLVELFQPFFGNEKVWPTSNTRCFTRIHVITSGEYFLWSIYRKQTDLSWEAAQLSRDPSCYLPPRPHLAPAGVQPGTTTPATHACNAFCVPLLLWRRLWRCCNTSDFRKWAKEFPAHKKLWCCWLSEIGLQTRSRKERRLQRWVWPEVALWSSVWLTPSWFILLHT